MMERSISWSFGALSRLHRQIEKKNTGGEGFQRYTVKVFQIPYRFDRIDLSVVHVARANSLIQRNLINVNVSTGETMKRTDPEKRRVRSKTVSSLNVMHLCYAMIYKVEIFHEINRIFQKKNY